MGLKCDLDKIWYSFNPALRPSDLSDQFCDVFSLTSLNQVHDIRETTFQSIKYPFPDMIPIHSFWNFLTRLKCQKEVLELLLKYSSPTPRVHSWFYSYVPMRARDCDLGTNIAQFSRFQENFHEENWSISHCKLNTDCLPLGSNNRNENKFNKLDATSINTARILCFV